MKLALLSLILFITSQYASAQVELSFGAFYRNDITFKKHAHLEPTYQNDPDRYYGYAFSINRHVDNHFFGIEFQYFDKSFDLNNFQIDSDYWSHGEFSDITRKYLSGRVKYGYLGTRFHFSQILLPEEKSNILFGAFFQIDGLVLEKESNHRDSTISSFSGVGYDFENDEKIYYTNTTYHPTSYDEFDLVEMKKSYVTLGANVGHRFQYKNFFTDLRATLGLNVGLPRFKHNLVGEDYEVWYINNDETLNKRGFYQFDLKVGYTF